jgi:hypothetical protein
MSNLSIFGQLVGEHAEEYPHALQLTKDLLKVVASYACSFKRNAHVSFLFVEQSRTLADKISEMIHAFETLPDSSPFDWTKFETVAKAIDPLEQCVITMFSTHKTDIF